VKQKFVKKKIYLYNLSTYSQNEAVDLGQKISLTGKSQCDKSFVE